MIYKSFEFVEKPPDLRKIKWSYLRLHRTTHLIFGSAKDIVSIFYSTKKQMRVLCVGGDMDILFFSDPAVFAATQKFCNRTKNTQKA